MVVATPGRALDHIRRGTLKLGSLQVLILDEFTSALDVEAEKDMLRLVHSMRDQGMTLLVISHKLQVVRQADHILLISNGRVSESGHHDELYASGGQYRKYWEEQNC